MALFTKNTVIFSPRLAACTISAVPIAARSPSPWYANHDLVGTGSLQPGGRGRSASVRHLHVAHIEVVVGKDGAADRADQDGLVLKIQVFQSFGDQFVGDAVAAAGAVVGLVLEVGFTLVFGIEELRLGVDDLVGGLRFFRDLVIRHSCGLHVVAPRPLQR